MKKIIIIKEKKEYIPELKKEIVTVKQRTYYVEDSKKDFSTKYGTIDKKELSKTGKIKTKDTKKEYIIFEADFIDLVKRFKKLPQTIPLKDIGLIIAETGINHKSTCLDTGTGSGVLTAMLANTCKKIYSYEIREDHLKIAQENIKKTGLKNVVFKQKSAYDEFEEKKLDLITLDLPEPWKAVKHSAKSLRVGGWLVNYSPSITSTSDFISEVLKNEEFLITKTVEIIERLWTIDGRRIHPKSVEIGHSGFLTFVRKIL